MESMHTPGPWRLNTVETSVGLCHTIGPFPKDRMGRDTYACVYVDGAVLGVPLHPESREAELLANANLMTSAPDLLGELRESTTDLVVTVGNIRAEMKRDAATADRWEGVVEHLEQQIAANRAAIARAEGDMDAPVVHPTAHPDDETKQNA